MRNLIEKMYRKAGEISDPVKRDLLRHALDKCDERPCRKDFGQCVKSFRESFPDEVLADAELKAGLAEAEAAEAAEVAAKAKRFQEEQTKKEDIKQDVKAAIMAELLPELLAGITEGIKAAMEDRNRA